MSAILELPRKVIEGAGSLTQLPDIVKEKGFQRIGVIMDPFVGCTDYVKNVMEQVRASGIRVVEYTGVKSEPTFASLRQLYEDKALMDSEMFLAVGGGSVMDTAKLLCVMAANPEFAACLDRAELITLSGRPLYAAPTTAGTGAEATPNAILFEEEKKKKLGIVSRRMIADTVLLDAKLTASLPRQLAACTGFDALAHALESFTSRKANPYSDMFAAEAMRLIFHNILPACREKEEDARQNMLLASFYAGVCLVTSSTHIVHAMAYPLAESFHVPHGKGIAALLAAGVRELGTVRTGDIMERCLPKTYRGCRPEELYRVIEEYQDILDVKLPLSGFGVSAGDCHSMAAAAKANKRLFDNCPVEIGEEALAGMYEALL